MVCVCHRCGLFAMAQTNCMLPTECSNAASCNQLYEATVGRVREGIRGPVIEQFQLSDSCIANLQLFEEGR